jgi:hypothetical protein
VPGPRQQFESFPLQIPLAGSHKDEAQIMRNGSPIHFQLQILFDYLQRHDREMLASTVYQTVRQRNDETGSQDNGRASLDNVSGVLQVFLLRWRKPDRIPKSTLTAKLLCLLHSRLFQQYSMNM